MLKVTFTFADHAAGDRGEEPFIYLAETTLGPDSQVRAFFEALPTVDDDPTADSQFLADLQDTTNSTIDTRIIAEETLARHLDIAVAAAIERGRLALTAQKTAWLTKRKRA